MDILTLDFETFYSKEFSLSKMTTESYITDMQFEVIGIAVKRNNEQTQWFSGTHKQTKEWLMQYDWGNSLVVAHNAQFDMAILGWRFGIIPKVSICTLCMARALHAVSVGGSLAALSEYYGLGVKGTEVLNALGKHRLDFNKAELEAYASYCVNDVELTYKLFKAMLPKVPKQELKLIDMTIRMYTNPRLRLDTDMLYAHLVDVRDQKEKLLDECGINKDDLMSNPKFAAVLESFGVEPPTKINSKGLITFAFAKTDEGFKALADHDDPRVQAIVAARLGTKSTLEETRTERFISIAERPYRDSILPVPLLYYGARTGRWSASDKINLQNIPRKSKLKSAIVAPEGYVIVGADLSAIELRMGLSFAGQLDKMRMLGQGVDLYKDFASTVYNVPISEITDEQRFMGKTCIAEGTLVLSDSGWKPIEQVSMSDKLWDGEEFVCHQGLIQNGLKETLPLCGIWLTPDHQVWSGTQWLESQLVVSDSSILSQVLEFGAVNLPSLDTYGVSEEVLRHLLLNVIAAHQNTQWINTTSKILKALDVQNVPEKLEQVNDIGLMQMLYLMMHIDGDSSVDLQRLLIDAETQKMLIIKTTGEEELQCTKNGLKTSLYFLDIFKRLVGGIFQNTIWTESTTIEGMNPEILDSYLNKTMLEISDKCQNLRRKLPVYDIASVGTKHRFTILTAAGPIIVHNCQLSLIYGTGNVKLRNQVKLMSGKDIGEAESKRIVSLYRDEYTYVVDAWGQGDDVLSSVAANTFMHMGRNNLIPVHGSEGALLPSGLYMRYPDLKKAVVETSRGKRIEWSVLKNRRERDKLYGSKVFQGLTQALARCIIAEAMLRIEKKYQIYLTIHDAVYILALEEEADEALRFVVQQLRIPPTWMPDIPLDAEGGYGRSLDFKMGKVA